MRQKIVADQKAEEHPVVQQPLKVVLKRQLALMGWRGRHGGSRQGTEAAGVPSWVPSGLPSPCPTCLQVSKLHVEVLAIHGERQQVKGRLLGARLALREARRWTVRSNEVDDEVAHGGR